MTKYEQFLLGVLKDIRMVAQENGNLYPNQQKEFAIRIENMAKYGLEAKLKENGIWE